MINTILGSKQQMSQVFVSGKRIPVTKISTNPCVVTQVKTQGKDGYWAVQLAFGHKSNKNTSKALKGHLKNSHNAVAPIFIRETKVKSEPKAKVGDAVKASDIFNVGDKVAVTGVSKGKGFAGGVKRWGFAGGPKTHGQSDRHRAPGSIGQGTSPGRVRKGKKMAGRMGTQMVTINNLEIININEETGDIYVSGPVTGHRNTPLVVSLISKAKKSEEKNDRVEQVVEKPEIEASEKDTKESHAQTAATQEIETESNTETEIENVVTEKNSNNK